MAHPLRGEPFFEVPVGDVSPDSRPGSSRFADVIAAEDKASSPHRASPGSFVVIRIEAGNSLDRLRQRHGS